jgi:2,4-dienoyl-CoA reductase-like NADH-dependent reductase (Old Yellow Enzyme family)
MFDKTFSPITIGTLTLPNRIVFAPLETNYATEEGYPTPKLVDFYGKIAEGGTGFIIVQATNVNPDPKAKATLYIPCLHDDRFVESFANWSTGFIPRERRLRWSWSIKA